MPGDHIAIAINEDRYIEAKDLNAFGDLPDLLFWCADVGWSDSASDHRYCGR